MYIIRKRLSDRIYLTGVICVLLSLFFFCIPLITGMSQDIDFGFFMLNFGIAGIYWIYRLVEKGKASKEARVHHLFLLLILLLISAWSLNRELEVFEASADWFSVLLVSLCLNYAGSAFAAGMPGWTKHALSFLNGVALLTFLYLGIYLMPLYAIGLIAFFFIGISLHVFVPALFFAYTIVLQRRMSRRDHSYWISFAAGVVAVIAVAITYTLQWNKASQEIDRNWRNAQQNKEGIPAWIVAAQRIPDRTLTKKILMGDLVYTVPDQAEKGFFWGIPQKVESLEERRQHDPLIMIASLLTPKQQIGESDRLKILQSEFKLHHQTERRLWRGDNLRTDSVNTEVSVWPRCNIAYTEKTITVRNGNDRFGRQEEAIYTFYMPEGSVVTSLSLWIAGKEEKGILTTKGRADTAYTTIVDRERRDPSVVHWREGNTVAVRIFPVLAGESRTFKIGITSPLLRVQGKLQYEDIYFKGPAFDKAEEEVFVGFEQPVRDFVMPASFVSKAGQSYRRKGSYRPGWSLQINDPGLSGCSFSFAGNEYALSPYHEKLAPTTFSNLYLDINGSWTKDEFDRILLEAKDKNSWVYDGGMILLNNNNKDALWKKLSAQRFGLFPLFALHTTEQALVITKNAGGVLRLSDLEESDFMARTKQFLSRSDKINLFNLSDGLSAYLQSLKEYRVFRYESGDVNLLLQRLQKGQFPDDIENASRVVVHTTDMIIEKLPAMQPSSGPDHVMRLFAYNHIMQQLGKGLLVDRPVEDSLVKEAQAAYVVSPVSSLIVLETQNDYDRFNIKDSGDSLKNASLHSKGAVPEPHEWVLIVSGIIILTWVVRKNKFRYSA